MPYTTPPSETYLPRRFAENVPIVVAEAIIPLELRVAGQQLFTNRGTRQARTKPPWLAVPRATARDRDAVREQRLVPHGPVAAFLCAIRGLLAAVLVNTRSAESVYRSGLLAHAWNIVISVQYIFRLRAHMRDRVVTICLRPSGRAASCRRAEAIPQRSTVVALHPAISRVIVLHISRLELSPDTSLAKLVTCPFVRGCGTCWLVPGTRAGLELAHRGARRVACENVSTRVALLVTRSCFKQARNRDAGRLRGSGGMRSVACPWTAGRLDAVHGVVFRRLVDEVLEILHLYHFSAGRRHYAACSLPLDCSLRTRR